MSGLRIKRALEKFCFLKYNDNHKTYDVKNVTVKVQNDDTTPTETITFMVTLKMF